MVLWHDVRETLNAHTDDSLPQVRPPVLKAATQAAAHLVLEAVHAEMMRSG